MDTSKKRGDFFDSHQKSRISEKRVIFILIAMIIIVVFILSIFITTYSGFVIQTPSSVSIFFNYTVNYTLFDGSTTDLSALSDTQLADIVNLTLEKSSYGKIVFNENVNLAGDAAAGFIDLNKYINISSNLISIDTVNLPSLEKSATLYLYGLSFSNPRILRNGAVCSDSICHFIGYSAGILTFSVIQFSSYSAEETPTTPEVPVVNPQTPSGGGGGSSVTRSFSVDKQVIYAKLKQGQTTREIIKLKNTGNAEINISIINSMNLVILSEESFLLAVGEEKEIALDFFAGEKEKADSYAGRLVFSGGGKDIVVNLILDVQEKSPLFDVKLEVPDIKYKPGEKINSKISIINVGDLENIDILLYYAIKNLDNEVLWFGEDSIAINKKLDVDREIGISEDLDDGDYILYVRASYLNVTASSSRVFYVSKELSYMDRLERVMLKIKDNLTSVLIVVLVIILLLAMHLRRKRSKKRKSLKRKRGRIYHEIKRK